LPFGADWTNDGRIVYSAQTTERRHFHNQRGRQRAKTINFGRERRNLAELSADGRFLIFMSNRTGQMDVWRSDANGTKYQAAHDNGNVQDAIIAPDGERFSISFKDSESKVENDSGGFRLR
jgi:Tol biopolymer transport system component